MTYDIVQIATIYTDFSTKFGIPRQSGIADTEAVVVFEEAYRDENALKGIEGYSHLWLIWYFSENKRGGFSPTVRPPRLGGNKRMGVFATRSPYRPNPIGLSSVKLLRVEKHPDRGTVLVVSGADLMDGTPILDVKPYLPFTDCHADAMGGFADEVKGYRLKVESKVDLKEYFGDKTAQLLTVLSLDPRPGYQREDGREYGMEFGGKNIRFQVAGDTLTVERVEDIRRK